MTLCTASKVAGSACSHHPKNQTVKCRSMSPIISTWNRGRSLLNHHSIYQKESVQSRKGRKEVRICSYPILQKKTRQLQHCLLTAQEICREWGTAARRQPYVFFLIAGHTFNPLNLAPHCYRTNTNHEFQFCRNHIGRHRSQQPQHNNKRWLDRVIQEDLQHLKAWQVYTVNPQWSAFIVPDHFPDSADSALSN